MKNLKIQVPQGYEIDKEKSTFEHIVFKKIEDNLPNKWENLKRINGYYVKNNSTISRVLHNTCDDFNKNIFKTNKQAQASIALAQLSQLMYVYNNGWTPDYTNRQELKFQILFNDDRLVLFNNVIMQVFLTFKTEELAEKFLNNFKNLILQAKPLL